MFDKDGGGTISTDELREVLGVGGNISEEVWAKIIREVDENGDGEIEYAEFKHMMQQLLVNTEDTVLPQIINVDEFND